MTQKISNHIFEIRFKPDSRILDKRGSIANQITNQRFNLWRISNSRIDFSSNKQPELSAFFSFRNLGITSNYPAKTNEFLKASEEFTKSAWQHFDTNSILRLGVKSICLIKTSSFKKAFDAYRRQFLKLNDDNIKKFGGDLVDLGFPLNFIDGDSYFNIMTGPMEGEQSKEIFNYYDIPKAGIFVEVDYFRKDISPHIISKHVTEFVKEGVKRADDIAKRILGLIDNV